MASKRKYDWKLGVRGVAEIAGDMFGLTARTHLSKLGATPRSKVTKEALRIANEREDRLVRVEHVLMAAGQDVKEVGDAGKTLRGRYRRERQAAAKSQAAKRKTARKGSRSRAKR